MWRTLCQTLNVHQIFRCHWYFRRTLTSEVEKLKRQVLFYERQKLDLLEILEKLEKTKIQALEEIQKTDSKIETLQKEIIARVKLNPDETASIVEEDHTTPATEKKTKKNPKEKKKNKPDDNENPKTSKT